MALFIIFFSAIFICIAIAENKDYEYLKKSAFTIMILAILNCITLSRLDNGTGDYCHYLGVFCISNNMVDILFNASMIIALISLIVYLFSDTGR